MVDFNEFVVMRGKNLEELNRAIDKVIEEKKSMDLDYDLMEKVLGRMVRNVRSIDIDPTTVVTPMKKEEMLKVTLDFFKSIDPELHRKAVDTILQHSDNIKMRIYNVHEIEDFKKRDEKGILKYTTNGNVYSTNGYATVHVPTKTQLDSKGEKILNKDECTLQDLYTTVHEISHLFDLDLELGKPDKEELEGGAGRRKTRIAREIFGEATTIAFEGMLTEYLLENRLYSKESVQQISNRTLNSNLQDARLVYAKLLLAKEKSLDGEITPEYIEEFMRDNGFSTQYIRRMADNIIHDPRDMLFEKRYALGGLIAPTIIKKYREEGASTLKRYLEESKNENFEGAMDALGIELNQEGINQLIINMKDYISRVNAKTR